MEGFSNLSRVIGSHLWMRCSWLEDIFTTCGSCASSARYWGEAERKRTLRQRGGSGGERKNGGGGRAGPLTVSFGTAQSRWQGTDDEIGTRRAGEPAGPPTSDTSAAVTTIATTSRRSAITCPALALPLPHLFHPTHFATTHGDDSGTGTTSTEKLKVNLVRGWDATWRSLCRGKAYQYIRHLGCHPRSDDSAHHICVVGTIYYKVRESSKSYF